MNPEIRQLQTDLARLGFDPGRPDGWRGTRTIRAIKAFQRAHGLVVDGVAGPQTREVIASIIAGPSPLARPEPDKSVMRERVAAAVAQPPVSLPEGFGGIAIPDTARAINEIVNHCAATREGQQFDARDIDAWHKQRGWSGIGYHFVVRLDGTIEAGRPIGQTGSHVAGRNKGTVGVAYVGGVAADGRTPKDTRTPEQRAAMLWLNAELASRFPVKRISGHNEHAAKACPSFDVRKDELGNIPGFKAGKRI